jgi:hypothetical protein
MSDAAWIALFNLAGVMWVAYLQYRLKYKVEVIHQATNSMKDALVAATASASHLQGMADQRKAEGK